MPRTYKTFTDNLEEQIIILNMWIKKRQDDMPIAAGHLACAVADLEDAIQAAEKRPK